MTIYFHKVTHKYNKTEDEMVSWTSFIASNRRNNLRCSPSLLSEEKCVYTRPTIGGYEMDDGDIILTAPTES